MKDNNYRKRTQKDYTMSFKLSVVEEVEKGDFTYKQAQFKYGIQGRSTVLKANKLLIKPLKRYHITTNSHHRFRKHSNLIEGLAINRPEQVWVADITYVGHRKNSMYLSLITDAYSKKIVGSFR